MTGASAALPLLLQSLLQANLAMRPSTCNLPCQVAQEPCPPCEMLQQLCEHVLWLQIILGNQVKDIILQHGWPSLELMRSFGQMWDFGT